MGFSTATAANENDLTTHLAAVWDNTMELNDGPLALLLIAQRST